MKTIRLPREVLRIDLSGVATPGDFNPFVVERVVSKLSTRQKLSLKMDGYVEVGFIKKEGWKSELPCYLFKCEEHGYQISTASGYEMILHCPKCLEEDLPDEEAVTSIKNLAKTKKDKSMHEMETRVFPNLKDNR